MDFQRTGLVSNDEIYEDLCNKIENLEYMPGTKLSENDLCKVYDVSRYVIRNVLALLKQRRLVDVFPQRGTYVSLIDMKYVEDVFFVREAVEQEAICRIIKMPERTYIINELKSLIDTQKKIYDQEELKEKFMKLDSKFHITLLKSIGKEDVLNLLSDSLIHIRRWRNYGIRSKEHLREILAEHEMIIKVIEAGDLTRARDVMQEHFGAISRNAKQLKDQEARYFIFQSE